MEWLKNFITNLGNKLINILKNNLKWNNIPITFGDYHVNILKNISFSDHFANVLECNGYHVIKYTNNVFLVLTRDVNYWFEIKFCGGICINFCNNNGYIRIDHRLHYYNNEYDNILDIENLSISQLNEKNNNFNELMSSFECDYYNIDEITGYVDEDHIYKCECKYILSTIDSLKKTYVKELILYLNKHLTLIIINYLLKPQNI